MNMILNKSYMAAQLLTTHYSIFRKMMRYMHILRRNIHKEIDNKKSETNIQIKRDKLAFKQNLLNEIS